MYSLSNSLFYNGSLSLYYSKVKPDGILYQKTDPAARLRHLLALPFTVQVISIC